MTRENWLETFTDHLRADFVAVGAEIPAKVRMSCGFTSQGRRGKRIGECWATAASADGTPEIFIVPALDDSLTVASVLTHELIHATGVMDHGKEFGRIARGLGLEGKLTATFAGDTLKSRLQEIIAEIGEYPHAELSGQSTIKKQTTRMLKLECGSCGFIARTTAKWLGEVGAPSCACNGETLTVCE